MLPFSEVLALKQVMVSAGEAIMNLFRGKEEFSATLKVDHTPVTSADLVSNQIITSYLTERYPGIPVISEETDHLPYSVRKTYSQVWLLDPLDGTREFLNRSGEFTINLGLVSDGVPIGGFIYVPVTGRFYFGLRGKGAYELSDSGKRQLTASRFSLHYPGIRVVMSRTHTESATLAYINRLKDPRIIHQGSALKFIAIADGMADYYPRMLHIMEWDTAAGQVLIEEAGGSMIDPETGHPLVYNKESLVNPFFIASGSIL